MRIADYIDRVARLVSDARREGRRVDHVVVPRGRFWHMVAALHAPQDFPEETPYLELALANGPVRVCPVYDFEPEIQLVSRLP